jgi:hypothetical protein
MLKYFNETRDGYEMALEYFDFNIYGAYVGDKTPIWCQDNFI